MGEIPEHLLEQAREWITIEAKTVREAMERIEDGEFTSDQWAENIISIAREEGIPEESIREAIEFRAGQRAAVEEFEGTPEEEILEEAELDPDDYDSSEEFLKDFGEFLDENPGIPKKFMIAMMRAYLEEWGKFGEETGTTTEVSVAD